MKRLMTIALAALLWIGTAEAQVRITPALYINGSGTARGTVTIPSGSNLVMNATTLSEADLAKIDAITNGTGAANKALVLDANADITAGLRALTLTYPAIGVTTTAGLTLRNTAAAAAGAQQYGPGVSQIGYGWETNTESSMPVETLWEVRPVQGAAAPTYNYVLMARVNEGSWTDIAIFSAGEFQVSGNMRAGGTGEAIYWSGRTMFRSPLDSTLTITNNAETAFDRVNFGPLGAATTSIYYQKKVTAIADNTATTVFTVTIPNANHAAAVRLMFLSSNGSTDAFESNRAASGMVVVARTTGANAVVTAATIDDAAIATVSGGATHTLAYSVSAISGAADASNTFTIQVTIDDSGNLGSNQVVAIAELLNAEATGVTIS